MQRSFSIYGSSSVLRGVRLEIGKDFRPPNKYDFSLEEDVIQKAEEAKALKEQLALEQEQEKAKKQPVPKPRVQACMGNDILQPTTVTTTKAGTTENTTTFNYKDFEDEADTPFEQVELQCIDNMDALKSVLQPNLNKPVPVACGSQYNPSRKNNPIDIFGSGLVSVVADSPSYPLDQNGVDVNRHGITNDITLVADMRQVPNSGAKSVPLPGAVKIFPSPRPTQLPPILPRRPKSMADIDLSTSIDAESENVPRQKAPIPKPRQRLQSPGQKLNVDQYKPPPLPPKKSKKKIPVYDPKVEHFPGHSQQSPLPPISPPLPSRPSRPDPFMSMNHDERELAMKLVAMGFPTDRVKRAVASFGCKENEIVDFLILVIEICNQGHSEKDAELVLKEYSLDRDKAIAFLGLMRQLKEFGFNDDQLFNALKESECDRDKTLDILTRVH